MKVRPEMADHPLSIAARELDDLSEQTHLPDVVDSIGLKADDLMYVAQQRALRCVLLLVRKIPLGHIRNIKTTQIYKLSAYELHLYHMFTACVMDGLAIGWSAQQKQENQTCTQNQQKK